MKITFKILFALILSIICWEFILETTIIKHPGTNFDNERGQIYKSGVYLFGEEGFSFNHINKLGLRAPEIKPKSKDEYRIIFLGDSFTESLHVPQNKSFPDLLGQKLNEKNKRFLFNTINAGMSGYSPALYIHLSKFYNSVLKPDYVVVQINDKDFSADLLNKQQKFYVIKNKNSYETVVNKTNYSPNTLKELLSRVSFVRVAREKYEKLFTAKPEIKNKKDDKKDVINYDAIYWSLKELKAKYKNVIILYIPEINYYEKETAPSIYETTIKQYAKRNKIDLIDMRQDYVDYYKLYKQPCNGFYNTKPGEGHINEIGHELIANRLFEYFNKRFQK